MIRLLIVEDDEDLREGLEYTFQAEGYEVTGAASKRETLAWLEKAEFDAAIMDCNLPDGNGFELCTHIRSFSNMPILMLTARDTEMDEVKALELGADDYMSKPFSLAVLKARLKKVMPQRAAPLLASHGITIDLSSCKVCKGQQEIPLSTVEFKLLAYLIENKGQVLSKEQILRHIWEGNGQFVDDNIVSVNIRRLRTKIEEDPSKPERIQTVHGIGYIWKPYEEGR